VAKSCKLEPCSFRLKYALNPLSAGTLPQTRPHWGSLALSRPLDLFRGPTSKGRRGRKGEEGAGTEQGEERGNGVRHLRGIDAADFSVTEATEVCICVFCM